MKKPILVVLAAGMGSRYGGLKQMDPVGQSGEKIIDYSVYDAIDAGFERVVFIINRKIEKDFKELVGAEIEKHVEVNYAFQELNDLPDSVKIPEDRQKPWGTSHAVYAAREFLDAPFAVINADDFYGRKAYHKMYQFLSETADKDDEYCMIGYLVKNTVTDKGSVSRGVCETENGYLKAIVERLKIEKREDGIVYVEEDGVHPLTDDTVVSMNFFGFKPSVVKEIGDRIAPYLNEKLESNPLKCEYFLPLTVDALLKEKKASVKVLETSEKWYGVTYHEDKAEVVEALKEMANQGKYPKSLWGK
ncbi:MAG: sugar phosphate nucleotidyltransferase [Eubacteriales bacterium]|nr:sugar phosphate nucleotidyltransferase [Eubacteriales bacterium]